MFVALATDPVGPVVPWVTTSSGPEEKKVAGPLAAYPVGADAVTGAAEPPGGSVTEGAGPCVATGPPKRLTLRR